MCLVALLCLILCNPVVYNPPDFSVHGGFPGKNTGVDCHALLQGIFPVQGSNLVLLLCRWIFLPLSCPVSPRTLEWVAYSYSRGTSWPRNWTGVSCTTAGFFTSWAIREALLKTSNSPKTCSIRFPGAQSAWLHSELPQGLLKVNSYSSTGFSLLTHQ